MKKLEKKIIKGVYEFETRQTLTEFVLKSLLLILLAGLAFVLILTVWTILQQQHSLDFFEIFFEDLDVIRDNFINVFETLIQEIPWLEILTALFIVSLMVVMVVRILLKLNRIKNKVTFLVRYWVEKIYEKWPY